MNTPADNRRKVAQGLTEAGSPELDQVHPRPGRKGMAARKTPEAAVEKLQELGATVRELQAAEAKVEELRERRNMQIYEAILRKATERKTAQIADVDPAYAHRCAISKGKPKSGHKT
jgi:hypothetical protein